MGTVWERGRSEGGERRTEERPLDDRPPNDDGGAVTAERGDIEEGARQPGDIRGRHLIALAEVEREDDESVEQLVEDAWRQVDGVLVVGAWLGLGFGAASGSGLG